MEEQTTDSRGASWTKELFEQEAGFQVSTEVWEEVWEQKKDVFESINGTAAAWDMMVFYVKSAEKFRQKTKELQQEKKKLQQQLNKRPASSSEETRTLVMSASAAAKDQESRDEFRERLVAKEDCRGGFIATKFYFEFVLAAREFGECLKDEAKIIQKVADFGQILRNRKEHSLFGNSCLDQEAPQSAVASELFRLAIYLLKQDESTSASGLKVTHQQQLVTDIGAQVDSGNLQVIRKKPKTSGEEKTSGKGKSNTKSDETKKAQDEIDICIWFNDPTDTLGARVVAACEYKPNNANADEREAQTDMYGNNILVLHQKPCIVINIAGSNNLDKWQISAHGLIRNEFSKPPAAAWEKTSLYTGTGAEAIVFVAHGLLKAKDSFPKDLGNFGSRLGPSVGKIDGHVYKVYDGGKVRQPNIHVVNALFDRNAVLLLSKDKKMRIMIMELKPSDWTQTINAKVFKDIITKLQGLHEGYGPHGDIRLANLLSTGDIIDFDFVRLESYPDTLQLITQDGERHDDVKAMIEKAKSDSNAELKPQKEHDWFSLGKVMSLFVPCDQSNSDAWKALCKVVEEGQNIPSSIGNFDVCLTNKSIPIKGTGNTPEKKQPRHKDTSGPMQLDTSIAE